MSTYVGKLVAAVSAALEFNTATLSGAMDVIVIEDPDGKRQSTPFHVRFGKLQLLKTRGIPINIEINGHRTPLRMFLGAAGEAYFYNPPQSKSEGVLTKSVSTNTSPAKISQQSLTSSDPLTLECAPSQSAPQLRMSQPTTPGPLDPPQLQQKQSETSTDTRGELDTTQKPVCLTPSLLSSQNQQREHDYNIAYVSDSEVELTRTARTGGSEFVEEPRSPPLFTSRRNWDASSSSSTFVSPTSSAPVSMSSFANVDTTLNTGNVEESDNSALFGLPSTPRRPRSGSTPLLTSDDKDADEITINQVTFSAEFTDVVIEEERKLDMRSVDGYDTDVEDDAVTESNAEAIKQDEKYTVSATETTATLSSGDNEAALVLQRHLRLALSSSQSVELDNRGNNETAKIQHVEPVEEILSMSLCGGLILENMQEEHIIELFDRHRLTYDDITSNPTIFSDSKLMFRVQNRIIDSRVAVPFLLTALAFNKCMDFDVLSRETANLSTNEKNNANGVDAAATGPSKYPETPSRRFGWFSWGAQTVVGVPLLEEEDISALEEKRDETSREVNGKESEGNPDEDQEQPKTATENEDKSIMNLKDTTEAPNGNADKSIPVASSETNSGENPGESGKEEPPVQNEDKDKQTEDKKHDDGQNHPEFSDLDPACLFMQPTAEQLSSLPLQEGANSMRFYVDESTVELTCRVFFWSQHSKIVISDVDGTITRSDVLGHLLPAVGRDWSQVGVAGLYTQIEKNGYKIVYLTARPIGQASQTRSFLHSVTQGSAKLPNGPVLMSPNRLVESFTREVIRRRPHEFKIAALRELRNLFPPDYNPFHAGFGNRDTDVISYRAVGLIPQRIFVVNPRGELVVMKETYESTASYSNLTDLVEKVFPDISGHGELEKIQTLTINSTYNDWHYWRGSLPDLNIEELLKK